MLRSVATIPMRAILNVLPALVVLVLLLTSAPAQTGDIDFQKARQLRQRVLQGERLSDDERAYLKRAQAAFQKKQVGVRKGILPTGRDSVGLTPLTDLAGDARYKGQDGGLYGGGRNEPPDAHLRAAMQAAHQIRPLDSRGQPSEAGKIVLLSVGMSNTTQEFRAFMTLAGQDPEKSASVVLVDGAQGGMDSLAWADSQQRLRRGQPDPWTVLDQRLQQADVTDEQVQVVWIKQARINPAALGEFPEHVEDLKEDLAVIVGKLKAKFPHLRLAYLSSRIYAGYASTPLNPEPYAYESAFAVRRLIEDQIRGEPDLNHDPNRGEVKAPLLLWGPYLWADGVKGRKTDDLVWERGDLAGDGTHPSPSGQRRVAGLLLRFLKTDPTAKGWFVRTATPSRAP